MNSKPMKMQAYASFTDWRADQSPENQESIDALSRLIEELAPHLEAMVKWGQGSWIDGKTPKIYIHAEPDHVQLGFYAGSTLDDPRRLLQGKGKFVRFVKIHTPDDIDPEQLTALIRQVA